MWQSSGASPEARKRVDRMNEQKIVQRHLVKLMGCQQNSGRCKRDYMSKKAQLKSEVV